MNEFYLVSSSHLDREWYCSFEEFRINISEIFFRVLNLLETAQTYRVFMVDGQMSVVEDFLEIYPEQKERVKRLAEARQLILGPWYTQPDEYLVDGESLIRNLELGMRMAKGFGNVMKIGYVPDTFGHIAQMPQIFKGFDIDKAFLMRGVEKREKQEFLWKAPDGSCVKTIQNLYGNCTMSITPEAKAHGTGIIQNPTDLAERLKLLQEQPECRTLSHQTLVTYCCDHCAPPAQFDSVMSELADLGFDVKMGTLEDYYDTIPWEQVKTIFTGELRRGKDIPLLRETAVSRPYLKRENQIAQSKLIHQAEPMAVLSRFFGFTSPIAFTDYAWKLLLQNHAHDSICGCSIDPVHEEMMTRFHKIEQVADRFCQNAGQLLLPALITETGSAEEAILTIFNTSFVPQKLVKAAVSWNQEKRSRPYRILDEFGKSISYQVLDNFAEYHIESDIDIVQRFIPTAGQHILLEADDLPAFGYRSYRIVFGESESCGDANQTQYPDRATLENEYLSVQIQPNGTFSVIDKGSGKCYSELHYFLDDGTDGDVYSFRAMDTDVPLDSRDFSWKIISLEHGSLMQKAVLQTTMLLPRESSGHGKRSDTLVENKLEYSISLFEHAREVRIHLCVDNQSADHRLRLILPTATNENQALSDAPFFYERRAADEFPGCHPFQTFVRVANSQSGIAFLGKGIHQYQLISSKISVLAITLLHGRSRLFSWLGYTDDKFSGIQCLGKNEYDYAIHFCAAGEPINLVHRLALAFGCAPLTFFRANAVPKRGAERKEFIQISNGPIQISSIRLLDNQTIELRIYNPTANENWAELMFRFPFICVVRTKLNGDEIERYHNRGGVRILVQPAGIETLQIRLT